MQERINADVRALPWELYFFEDGGWVLLDSFETEQEAIACRDALHARSKLPRDHYALIGPDDVIMPLEPASVRR